MRFLPYAAAVLFGLVSLASRLDAQEKKKKGPDNATADTRTPAKKAPPQRVVIQGLTYEVLMTSEDKVGAISAPTGEIIRKWNLETDAQGNVKVGGKGYWTKSSFTWTVNLPKETPPVRVLVPIIVDGKVTVRVGDREVWKVDYVGKIAKGNLSPVVAIPGDTPQGVQIAVEVDGAASNFTLLVPAKDAPAPKAEDVEKAANSKAAELLAKAKEALNAKSTALAKVRLKAVVAEYGQTPQAEEARALLKALEK